MEPFALNMTVLHSVSCGDEVLELRGLISLHLEPDITITVYWLGDLGQAF